MKFKKNRGGGQGWRGGQNSSTSGTRTKVKGRKQLRKEKRLQKKQNKASFFAARNNRNRPKNDKGNSSVECNNPQSNNSRKIKQLQAFVEAEKLKLRNGKAAASKDKEQPPPTLKGKKKKVTFQNCHSDSPSDEEENTGGFQQASTSGSNDRLARLQEFVNQEACKMQGNKSNSTKSEKIGINPSDNSVKVKSNLIKDWRRLRALREDQKGNTKEINRLARLLRYGKHQKGKVGPCLGACCKILRPAH